jgi:hypothetical protein
MSARCPGRKRSAPITMPALESLPAAERPKAARAMLQAVANPRHFDAKHESGEVVITQKLPAKVREDDRLTPERRRHAVEAELLIAVDTFTTEAGERTQLKRQRLISPLEQLWKAGTIDADQFAAARRFQRDVDRAAVAGPRMSVKYEPRMIDGIAQPFLSPVEAQQDHQRRVEAARRACGDKLVRMLEWVALEPCGWRAQAKAWWPAKSETAARVEFKRLLRLCCSALEGHYRRR